MKFKDFLKCNINKVAIIIIVLNLFVYTLLSTTVYADDFVDKPVVNKPASDLATVMTPVIGPQQVTAEILSELANDLVSWESGKLNDILDEQIGADDVLKDYYEVYYDLLVNDYQNVLEKYCAGGSKFNDDGTFVTEYTNAYYRHYFKALYQFSEPFDWDLFIEYANERNKSELSGNSTDTSDYIKKKGGKPRFSAPSLKKAVNTANSEYSPKSTGKYISYRTDEWYKTKEENFCLLPLYNGGFCGERWSEIYLMPFYTDGEDRYYSEFQLHFYLERVDNENGDGWTITFAVEWFSNFDDIEEKKGSYVIKEGMTSPEYVYLSSVIDIFQRICLFSYPSLSNALERSHSGQFQKLINFNSDFMRYYKSGDLSTYITVNNTSNYFGQHFRYEYSKHDSSCIYGSLDDIGYYYSNTPIMFSYSNIDTSKIPDSYYITVNGDTIYDYSITNPDTGQSSTINEYITNNYTYITNNNPGGDGSGSGTTGGNVTVGGNIGVNGSVNVGGEVNVGVDVSPIDINVNVSGNGGAGESGGEPPEIGGLDDLVGYLPEKSPAISQYLEIFFDTLPPELLALILAGVAVAVIKLIFRR